MVCIWCLHIAEQSSAAWYSLMAVLSLYRS